MSGDDEVQISKETSVAFYGIFLVPFIAVLSLGLTGHIKFFLAAAICVGALILMIICMAIYYELHKRGRKSN